MKRKAYRKDDYLMYYDHFTTRDFFDVKLFKIKRKGWRSLFKYSGANAERKAVFRAAVIFNYTFKKMLKKMISEKSAFYLNGNNFGKIILMIEDTDKFVPQTFNKYGYLKLSLSLDTNVSVMRRYVIKPVPEIKKCIFNSLKIKK